MYTNLTLEVRKNCGPRWILMVLMANGMRFTDPKFSLEDNRVVLMTKL
jgi:hypothetical protein